MPEPMTVPGFVARKGSGRPLVVLTAYDFLTARLFDDAGVDALLVGDSMGTVVQGRPNTLGVTLDAIAYHTEIVARAARQALVIADMPFLSYHTSVADAIRNAGRLLQEGGAQAVKLEGGERCAETIRALVRADIPVMGHVGLTPQSIHKLGKYHVQRDEAQLLADARAVEEAGAFGLVLEVIPSTLAQKVTSALSIPTIGIGAGPACDGQVLVWQDAFGLTPDFKPRFVKQYANLHAVLTEAARRFCDEVRSGQYPDSEHSYS